jgi:hypothetical protein
MIDEKVAVAFRETVIRLLLIVVIVLCQFVGNLSAMS